MASEGDCELTSSVARPSSGSLPGDKTTGEGASIQHTTSSGQENQPQISVAENEGSIQNTASSGLPQKSQPQTNVSENETNAEFSVNMEKPEETKKARDINESGDRLKHSDKADEEKGEDENQDQDIKAEVEKDHDASLKETTTPTLSSPQPENDPHDEPKPMDKENVNKPEKSEGESRIMANESSDELRNGDKADEEKGEDEGQDQDIKAEVEKDHDASVKEKTTPTLSSPQPEKDPHAEPGPLIKTDEENINKHEKSEGANTESLDTMENLEEKKNASDINESGDRFKPNDKADEEKGEDEDQDQDINLVAEAKQDHDPNLKEPLQHTATSGLPQEKQPQTRVGGNDKLLWIGAFFAVILAYVVFSHLYFSDLTPPVPNEFNVVDVFNQNMKKLETSFPNQRPELWRRSLIHLRRHLKTERPTEPVSLILTSGHRAERTLGCLARCLAQAFSTALNSSVLNINGISKASQNSDQVKLDIDRELRKAFEGKKFAAVIHRFEELPPGSTLIFYRYCDHENAAYKNVFLAFTVMLEAEVEVPSSVGLGRVEEMVQEHVKQKFVSSDKLATFNEMDVDKLSGLWSRISHLILPVAAEETIERQGCADCDESF